MGVAARTACVALLLVGTGVEPGSAEPAFSGQLEMGFGPTFVRPLVAQTASGATASVGARRSIRPGLRAGLEMNATVGGELGHSMYFEPPALPGTRTLYSILLGIEASPSRTTYGAFGYLGVGAGRMDLKGAAGRFSWTDPSANDVPDRSLTAFATGLGLGYRFRGGPGLTAFQIALRTHALIDHGWLPASTYALAFGFATSDEPRVPRPKRPKHEGHSITEWPR